MKKKLAYFAIIIILLIVATFVYVKFQKQEEPVKVIQQITEKHMQKVVEEPQITEKEIETFYVEDKCTQDAALAYKTCFKKGNGDLDLVLKKRDEIKIAGAQELNGDVLEMLAIRYTYYDENNVAILKANTVLNNDIVSLIGNEVIFNIPYSNYPQATKVEIIPIVKETGKKPVICFNQRIMIIPQTNCK